MVRVISGEKNPARNAPVVVRAGSSDNSRMSSQNRRTPSGPVLTTNHYEINLLGRKHATQVAPTNVDPICKYHYVCLCVYVKSRIEY